MKPQVRQKLIPIPLFFIFHSSLNFLFALSFFFVSIFTVNAHLLLFCLNLFFTFPSHFILFLLSSFPPVLFPFVSVLLFLLFVLNFLSPFHHNLFFSICPHSLPFLFLYFPSSFLSTCIPTLFILIVYPLRFIPLLSLLPPFRLPVRYFPFSFLPQCASPFSFVFFGCYFFPSIPNLTSNVLLQLLPLCFLPSSNTRQTHERKTDAALVTYSCIHLSLLTFSSFPLINFNTQYSFSLHSLFILYFLCPSSCLNLPLGVSTLPSILLAFLPFLIILTPNVSLTALSFHSFPHLSFFLLDFTARCLNCTLFTSLFAFFNFSLI